VALIEVIFFYNSAKYMRPEFRHSFSVVIRSGIDCRPEDGAGVVGYWRGYLSGARCRLAYGPADATATHCLFGFTKIQIGFTFLVPAHPGSPGKRAVKRVCVCVPL